MAQLQMCEADVAGDLNPAVAEVQRGVEVVIEHDHRSVAILNSSRPAGRMISEIMADLTARGSNAAMDEDFARDIEEGIKVQRQPWSPPV